MTDLPIAAADGFELAASLFEPLEPTSRASVIVNPATGVRRRYYQPFAEYLNTRGMRAVTFDYRGIGESRPPAYRRSLRGFRATMTDWAARDTEGVLAHLERCWPGTPVLLVGHSFGGQGLGLVPSAASIRAAVMIAAQSGYWGHFAGSGRLRAWPFWHLLLPLATRLFGYFPAKLLRFSEDLPAGVALEWASWGRHRDYLLREAGRKPSYEALALPILALSFTDDAYAPEVSVTDMLERFPNADREHLHLSPADVGAQSVGHFGFFRERFEKTLWPIVGDWLDSQIGARRQAVTR